MGVGVGVRVGVGVGVITLSTSKPTQSPHRYPTIRSSDQPNNSSNLVVLQQLGKSNTLIYHFLRTTADMRTYFHFKNIFAFVSDDSENF